MSRTDFVLDIDAYTAASAMFRARTGRLLTIGEYQRIVESSARPFFSVLLAAEYARANAEAQADSDQYIEEMSIGGKRMQPRK
jgi:hypothetical protein